MGAVKGYTKDPSILDFAGNCPICWSRSMMSRKAKSPEGVIFEGKCAKGHHIKLTANIKPTSPGQNFDSTVIDDPEVSD